MYTDENIPGNTVQLYVNYSMYDAYSTQSRSCEAVWHAERIWHTEPRLSCLACLHTEPIWHTEPSWHALPAWHSKPGCHAEPVGHAGPVRRAEHVWCTEPVWTQSPFGLHVGWCVFWVLVVAHFLAQTQLTLTHNTNNNTPSWPPAMAHMNTFQWSSGYNFIHRESQSPILHFNTAGLFLTSLDLHLWPSPTMLLHTLFHTTLARCAHHCRRLPPSMSTIQHPWLWNCFQRSYL